MSVQVVVVDTPGSDGTGRVDVPVMIVRFVQHVVVVRSVEVVTVVVG